MWRWNTTSSLACYFDLKRWLWRTVGHSLSTAFLSYCEAYVSIVDVSWHWSVDLRENSHVQFAWFHKTSSTFSLPTSFAHAANLKMYFVLQDRSLLRKKKSFISRLSRSETLRYAVPAVIYSKHWCNSITRMSSREFFTSTFIAHFLSTAFTQMRKGYGAIICGRKLSFGFQTSGVMQLSNSTKSMYCNYHNTLVLLLTQRPSFDGLPQWPDLTHFLSVIAVDFTDGTVLGDLSKVHIHIISDFRHY